MSAPFARREICRPDDRLLAVGLFVCTLALYLRTLCPTIYWGDCGELVTVVSSLGIAHSTGYPVWCLLGKAWTYLIPFGSFVWRLNTMSAFFGALAVAALFAFARSLALSRPIAVAVAGLFAVGHTFWQQCLFAETYSLTACYTCILLWLTARWRARGCRPADLRLLAIAYGFALTNHQTNTLFLPGFVAFILWTDPTLRPIREAAIRRRWASAILPGLLPLLFYAYIPIRAHAQPAANWGDPQTPFAFFYHVTGRPYAPLMFHYSLREALQNLEQWALGLGGEYAWPVVALGVYGLIGLWRGRAADRPLALLLSWIVLADVVYTINYTIYNAYIYFIPSYVALAMLAGIGLRDLWTRIEPTISTPKRPAYAALGAACLCGLVPVQAVGHFAANDLSRNWTCLDYGRNLLKSCPPNAILINNGGDTGESAVNYLQKVEDYRTDVVLVNRGVLSGIYDIHWHRWANIWYFEQLRRKYPAADRLYADAKIRPMQALEEDVLRQIIAQAVAQDRPVAVIKPAESAQIHDGSGPKINFLSFLNRHYETAQIGLTVQVFPKKRLPAPAALLAETRRGQSSYATRGVYENLYFGDDYLTPIALDYFNADIAHARLARAQGAWEEAAAAYDRAAHLFRSQEASAGLAFCTQVRQREAKR